MIVCTHNGHAFLPECLRALSELRYPNYEVIVVDDGSKPGIEQIVRAAGNARYRQQPHRGLSAARNLGAKEARGEILAYTDDDCVPDRDWLDYLGHGV